MRTRPYSRANAACDGVFARLTLLRVTTWQGDNLSIAIRTRGGRGAYGRARACRNGRRSRLKIGGRHRRESPSLSALIIRKWWNADTAASEAVAIGVRVQIAPCGPNAALGEFGRPVRLKNECFGVRIRVAGAALYARVGEWQTRRLEKPMPLAYTFKSCRAHQFQNVRSVRAAFDDRPDRSSPCRDARAWPKGADCKSAVLVTITRSNRVLGTMPLILKWTKYPTFNRDKACSSHAGGTKILPRGAMVAQRPVKARIAGSNPAEAAMPA